MTLHLRQPLNAKLDTLVEDALFAAPAGTFYRDVVKRVLDVALVLVAALPVFMVLVVLAAVIALDGKSPIYLQKRVGKNGRIFHMWKLRSMVTNADEMLKEHLAQNPAARAEWDRDQKLKNDPRITTIGRIIRKTSLDELPQLWNVLRGDMSLVGPRPMMVDQQSIYPGSAYYALRPGITGFWQISVRNESSFGARASFDADYLGKVSFVTDLKVLFRTVAVVVKGTGC